MEIHELIPEGPWDDEAEEASRLDPTVAWAQGWAEKLNNNAPQPNHTRRNEPSTAHPKRRSK